MMRQVELVESVLEYDPDADEDLLNRAYVFTVKVHGSQTRASGDPYFSHPIEVAGILTRFKLDTDTIATALLHDTIEDTVADYDQIEEHFGPQVAKLVDGVTKLSKLELQSDHTKQAENFRKLLLAMSDDIRVLLVKLADRLHNMRTLHYLDSEQKRRRIASETMEIYAPLAERIGMHDIKDELQDLAFTQLNGEGRGSIIRRLDFLRASGDDTVDRVSAQLQNTLAEAGIEAEVMGRLKRPYSIWRKMQLNSVSFEQLSDVIAFRILVKDQATCYQTLGAVHAAYPMVPGRFKDYISTPKRNNYQSLHTSVIGPDKLRIEMQIRTHSMHEIAEYGVAAHWMYKQSNGKPLREGVQYRWIRELLEIMENTSDPEEFLEHTKLSMFQDQVFCFSPKGDLIALPQGGTPVDFAYAVHTDLGNSCVSARVNGRNVPLREQLHNGDQVEIIRSENQTPSPTWENFVVTGRARSAIRRFIRQQERSEYVALGRQIIDQTFISEGHEVNDKMLESVLSSTKRKDLDDLLGGVGRGELTGRDVLDAAYPSERIKSVIGRVVPLSRVRGRKAKPAPAVPIRGLAPGMAVHMSQCCHPLPGERIVGIVTVGKGITIHTADCDVLKQFSDTPERWINVAWDPERDGNTDQVARIETVVTHEPGALSRLTAVIAQNAGNISNLRITDRSSEFFEMKVDIEVRDVHHLSDIITALRAEPQISSVERVRG